jgi:hydrogenase maturation protease
METPRAGTLVIGYGSPIRGDDGVGQAVARAVEAWDNPSIRAIAVHQLVPELAAEMAVAGCVLFVDASADPNQAEVEVENVTPSEADGVTNHFCSPAWLLALCRELFQSCPRTLLIKVPAPIMTLGEGLSSVARRGAGEALEMIRSIAQRVGGGTAGA